MKKIFYYSISCFTAIQLLGSVGCANIVPPSGGPRDSLPPKLIAAIPKDSAIHFSVNKITLTFDEFVEAKDVQQNLIVSPNPKNQPIIDYKLHNVTIKLKDSLEPNTTYTLNFGNAIRDVNEGNVLKNFSYVFTTGVVLDNGTYSGKVQLAETGKTDSTLIVLLHRNLSDTSVVKNAPRYYTKLNGKGQFAFNNLPKGLFNVFVLPNDYSKRYDDSTKLFAFVNMPISIGTTADTSNSNILYAYQEEKKKDTKSKANNPTQPPSKKEDNQLRYSLLLESGQQDLLQPNLQLTFIRPLKKMDSSKIVLCDTFYRPISNYTIQLDSTRKTVIIGYNRWKEQTPFKLLIAKDAVLDSTDIGLLKGDTLAFSTKKEADYGSTKLRFNGIDFSRNPVLQIVDADKIKESVTLTTKEFTRKLYKPGDYELRILYDTNKDGLWTPGNYKKKLQPETVYAIPQKLTIKANWDNDNDYEIGQ